MSIGRVALLLAWFHIKLLEVQEALTHSDRG